MRRNLNAKLAVEYMNLIDPSGDRPIGTGYRVGPNLRDFKARVIPHSSGVVDYFNSLDPAGNMWVQPAPRRNHTAYGKGGAWGSWVAWVDYDEKLDPSGQGLVIPTELRPHVWQVRSGTPGNYHLYIPFIAPVSRDTLTVINWLFRQVVHGDAKHADNSLLRLPGSFNAKNGAQVVPEIPLSRVVRMGWADAVDVLAGLMGVDKMWVRIKRDVLARSGTEIDGLTVVDVTAQSRFRLPGRIKAALRYQQFPTRGNRSNSRFGFWRDFWKAGLTLNETYSLMLKFDPMRDVFDWETDLVRCWGKYEAERV